MKNTGFGFQYEEGIDYMSLDFTGYEDIAEKLQFTGKTSLNLLTLSKELQNTIQGEKPKNQILPLNDSKIRIILELVLQKLLVKSYIIVEDNNERDIKRLKKQGVCFVGSINDFGDFNINSIDGHFNSYEYGILTRNCLAGRYNRPFVLFFDREQPIKMVERIKLIFSGETQKLLTDLKGS